MSHEMYWFNEESSPVQLGEFFKPSDITKAYFAKIDQNGKRLNDLFTPYIQLEGLGHVMFKIKPQLYTNKFRKIDSFVQQIPYFPEIHILFGEKDEDHSDLIGSIIVNNQEYSSYIQFYDMGESGEFSNWVTNENYLISEPVIFTPSDLYEAEIKVSK